MILLACIGLLTFIQCAATQDRESNGQYIDDSVITAKIKAAILNEPSLKVFQISVKTFEGKVWLNGTVNSEQICRKAEEIAGRIEGVTSVVNNLVVKCNCADLQSIDTD